MLQLSRHLPLSAEFFSGFGIWNAGEGQGPEIIGIYAVVYSVRLIDAVSVYKLRAQYQSEQVCGLTEGYLVCVVD